MKTEIHTSPALFDELAAEWDALVTPCGSLSFFMRSNWQRIWWKHLHRGDLFVVTMRDERGALLGIAPLFAEHDAEAGLTFGVIGGVDVTDYVDLICAPGCNREVLEAFLSFLCSPDVPNWSSIHIRNIPQSSPTLSLVPEIASRMGLQVETSVEDVCPVIDLPDSYEAYLNSLSKKDRHELRRKRRRAEAYPVGWYTVGPEHDLQAEIDAFLDLMAMSTPEKAEFLTKPGHRDFFKEIGEEMFRQGVLDLSFLTVDGVRAAAMWNYAYADRMMLYNSGLNQTDFSALSPGIVLLAFNIEHTIQRGFKKYDFLQGDEDYKFRLGGQTTTVHNLIIRR